MKKYTFKKVQNNNCGFATIYLILRCKVARLIFLSGRNHTFVLHFVGLTKNGHAIHFRSRNGAFPPFWFQGSYEIIHRDFLQNELKNENRKVLLVLKSRWSIYLISMIGFTLTIIPFSIGWLLYLWIWLAGSFIKTIKKC